MLFRTTKERKHAHIAYINRSAGQGLTSVDAGHAHPIVYIPETPPQIDPQTGAEIPGAPGGYQLAPGDDGHTHAIAGLVKPKAKETPADTKDLAAKCLAMFRHAREIEHDFRKAGDIAEGFYCGDDEVIWKNHHGQNIKQALQAEDRAALSFNEIEAKIDLLSGYQRQNRFDIKFLPVEDGDARVADILTAVAKNINEQCNFDHEETKVFEDEMIPGRGCYHVYIDYDKDLRGAIRTERFPWNDVWFGPHERETLEDCEHAHKARWFSRAKIKQLWPDKAKDIDSYQDIFDPSKRLHDGKPDQYDRPDTETPVFGADPDFVNIAKKEMRVFETQFKEYDRVTVLTNAQDDFVLSAAGWDSKDIQAVKTIDGFSAIPRNITRFRVVTWSCNTILDDTYSDFDDFTIIPVYAKKRGKRIWGKVHNAIDPQREINKRRSQVTDILNKVATYGYFYDSQTFENERDERKFKQNASRPGFTQKVMDINRKPVKEEGVKFPAEIVQMITMDSNLMREILNINMEMQGISGANTSGAAIAEKKHSGLVGNEYLFDALSMAKRKIGRLYIQMIRKVYTPERILRLIENNKNPVKSLENADREEIARILEDFDIANYDVVASESEMSPTMQLANFKMFMEMAGQGVPIPPEMLIKLSSLPDVEKQEALQQLQAQQQAAAQNEQMKSNTELQKVILSKQQQPGTPQI